MQLRSNFFWIKYFVAVTLVVFSALSFACSETETPKSKTVKDDAIRAITEIFIQRNESDLYIKRIFFKTHT